MPTNKLFVTQPSLPSIDEFKNYLDKIWESKWLTNNGEFHEEFEKKLKEYLNVDFLSLVSNGTLALLIAIKALNLKGEIITTPFTFVATVNAIEWLGCKPVFCDINEDDFNIDPNKIEALITKNTIAIMPVHVYGIPCDNEKLVKIAERYNLKLIYDAAHAFNVKKGNEEVLNYGDFATLSFHATKAFNTIEGGAIISHSQEDKELIDQLRNFGYNNENTIVRSGINSKMNELQSAFGLLQMDKSVDQIKKREIVYMNYLEGLKNVKGIIIPFLPKDLRHNYTYFPVRITPEFKLTRDELVLKLNKKNIFPRKYFYPLVSNMLPYKYNVSGNPNLLPIANLVAEEILCLPIYEELSILDQNIIINSIIELNG
jgi:dTDP-4-amino-4,6-dideoxygalactose transaminase